MNKEKLGQEPAFPCEVGFENGEIAESHQNGNTTVLFNGMSKRFYAACAAMQGIISGIETSDLIGPDAKHIVLDAYEIADELLKQEKL